MKQIRVHQLKSDRARSYLRGKLLMLPEGGSLPGLRTMCAESGVGRKILEQAIIDAEKDGLLFRKARSGFYRTAASSGKADLIIYADNSNGQLQSVGCTQIPSSSGRIILHLQDLARKQGLTSRLVTSFQELPELPVPLFCVSLSDPGLLALAEARAGRVVTISGQPGKLWVKAPYELATRAGLEHLAALGHKAVGYTYFRHTDPAVRDRHLFEYYRFMAEYGFKVEPSYTIPYPGEAEIAEGLRVMFSSPRPPTALFAQSVWLPTCYRVLKELRINIPWQVSVLGLGDMEFIERLHPFPAFVNESAGLMAEKAWELMFDSKAENAVVTPPP